MEIPLGRSGSGAALRRKGRSRRQPDAALLPYETFRLLLDVAEDIAVEDRSGDLPYLLAGLRLGRLTDPVRRSEAERRIARLRRHLRDG